VIRQDRSAHAATQRERYLERVPFDLIRDWTSQRQSGLLVVGPRTQNQRWTPTRLLVLRLRIEGEPYQVTRIRHKSGHLPGFLTLRDSPIRLAMAILFRNSRYQLIQRVLSTAGTQHNASISLQVER
jgi:hypothetical protein